MSHIKFALSAAKEAGEFIKSYVEGNFKVEEKSSAFDLVTEVDQKAEELIRKKIKSYDPTHYVIGEEGINKTESLSLFEGNDEYIWILDPIDGTSNFVHGLPGYTVSIGLMYKKEIILGVIYDPSVDEIFWAEKGKGAYRGDTKLVASNIEEMSKSILATGFPSDVNVARPKVINGINILSPNCNNIRSYGSAALHLAYVAAGRLEGFWEYGLNIWDVAAGYIIVKEAGGEVTHISGKPYNVDTSDILASNGRLHSELSSKLNVTKGYL